jgi:hypothetical protein
MLVYTIIMVVYGVVSMVVSAVAYYNFNQLSSNYSYVVADFKQSPITNLRLATTTSCNTGEVSIFNYTWPGTVAGCDCTGVTSQIASQYSDVK